MMSLLSKYSIISQVSFSFVRFYISRQSEQLVRSRRSSKLSQDQTQYRFCLFF